MQDLVIYIRLTTKFKYLFIYNPFLILNCKYHYKYKDTIRKNQTFIVYLIIVRFEFTINCTSFYREILVSFAKRLMTLAICSAWALCEFLSKPKTPLSCSNDALSSWAAIN